MREELSTLRETSARQQRALGEREPPEEAGRRAQREAELHAAKTEAAAARGAIGVHEAALARARELEAERGAQLVAAQAALSQQQAASARELETAHSLWQSERAAAVEAARESAAAHAAAREGPLMAQLAAAREELAALRTSEGKAAAETAEESGRALATLRAQLLASVQKEVAARGAAGEMAALLREQQTKLTQQAEARRALQAELAAARQAAAAAERDEKEQRRQEAAAHAAALAGAHAAATQEQLACAQAKAALEAAEAAAEGEGEALSRDHAETLRLKDTLLEDFAGQLAEAKRELQRRAAALTDAERRRDAAAHEAEALASAQETIAVQEGAISRLEAKVEEIDEQRAAAVAAAAAARTQLEHKEGLLSFVEKEVRPESPPRES